MSPIVDLQRRLHEAGRIRIGVQVPAGRNKTRPQRLTTFRFTGQDRRALDWVAKLYGGTVEAWQGAPVGEQFEVISRSSEIRVAVPPERMALSQSYELWSGGGCQRRCDGVRQTNDEPCLCATLDAEDQTPRCSRHTRLSLMLADLPTTGLWRLDTQGYYASEELAGAFELGQIIQSSSGKALLPGWLRLEQREVKRPGEPPKKFAVPVLDYELDAAALLGPSRHEVSPISRPQLGAGPIDAEPEPDQAGLTPISAGPPPSLKEELAAIDAPPPKPSRARKNAAAPIRTTGIKPRTAAEAATPKWVDDMHTDDQRRALMAAFGDLGVTDRQTRLGDVSAILGRDVRSVNELSKAEASAVIDALDERLARQQYEAADENDRAAHIPTDDPGQQEPTPEDP